MGSYCYCIVVPWLGGIDQMSLKEIIAAPGIGCEKLEQVDSLFWSMTKRGKKKVDRNNCK